ncbi:MAG: radical SAM protein [Candidatus Omnitrophica bacterium]|nr:radical SAM protein [Candidatus Omnitrophota bacterium]
MPQMPNDCIRETISLCSRCHKTIPAYVVERGDKISMEKHCPEHGKEELTISNHPWYYKELTGYYFGVMPVSMPQKRFYIYLSNRCNLNCPICLLYPNQAKVPDISLSAFKEVIKKNKGARFYLYGAEPTLRDDLREWIILLKSHGNLVNMHTNGIKLADYDYVCRLKQWGVDYISVQFDGFDDTVYRRLRGRDLLEVKRKALDNLKRLDIATGLNVTIAKGINEDQMRPIIDYAVDNPFIKDVSFATLSFLGDAGGNFPSSDLLMPEDLIDIVERQSDGNIGRRNLFLFQKLYYTLLAVFEVRRCYNFQHMVVYREGNGRYVCLDDLFDLEKLEPVFAKYRRLVRNNRLKAAVYFLTRFFAHCFGKGFLKRVRCVPWAMFIPGKIRNITIPPKTLFVSFGTVCDAYKYDRQINEYCGQGFCFSEDNSVRMTDSIPDLTLFREKGQTT